MNPSSIQPQPQAPHSKGHSNWPTKLSNFVENPSTRSDSVARVMAE